MKDVLKMIRFDYISVKPLTVPYVIGFIAVCLVLSLFGIPLGVFCFAASAAVFAPVQEQASSDTRKIYGILPVRRDAVTKAAFLEMTVPLFIGELLSLIFLLISNSSKLYRIFPKTVVSIIEELFDFSENDANIAFGELCIIKLCALTALFMTAAASVFILLIKLKMKRANKLRNYTGIGIITAGQAAKIMSVAAVVVLTSFAAKEETYGFPKAVGVSAGVIQIVCMVLCVLAAIFSVYALLAKNSTGLDKFRYIFNIAGNALTVLVIAYFDIYKFWGC